MKTPEKEKSLRSELFNLFTSTVKLNCDRGITIDISEFVDKLLNDYELRRLE